MVALQKAKSKRGGKKIEIFFAFVIGILLGNLNFLWWMSSSESCLPAKETQLLAKSTTGGWHGIQVFYGDGKHLKESLDDPEQKWYSQANQDQVIHALFRGKRNGYFVDLAANHATSLSNTYSLETELEWSGLCIEPNSMYWDKLAYRDCQVVGAVVGKTKMEEVKFIFNSGEHGGIFGDNFDNKRKGLEGASQPKYTVTLLEILERFNAPKTIDYLSLDVEGAEEFIMSAFPLDKYTISVLTVERPNQGLLDLFEKHGYKQIMRLSSWGEQLFVHKSVIRTLNIEAAREFESAKAKEKRLKAEAEAKVKLK